MKIPANIKIPGDIAKHVIDTYGLYKGLQIDMKYPMADLIRLYVNYEGPEVGEVSIEQFNGDEGSYMIPPNADEMDVIFGKTVVVDIKDPTKTCTHTWIRYHSYDEFVKSVSLLISMTAETHKGRLYDHVKTLMDESSKYFKMVDLIKS